MLRVAVIMGAHGPAATARPSPRKGSSFSLGTNHSNKLQPITFGRWTNATESTPLRAKISTKSLRRFALTRGR